MVTITPQLLATGLGSRVDNVAEYVPFMNQLFPQYDVVSKLRIAHFLSQIAHESGNFSRVEENLNYSAERLIAVWPRHFDSETANRCHRKPELIANVAYADRNGNGDEASGDGWKYRGRGLIQCTGKTNYTACGEALGVDLLDNPDILLSPEFAVASALWYWDSNNLNRYADADSVTDLTRRINGGYHGLDDRKAKLAGMKKVLGILGDQPPMPGRKPTPAS